MSEEVPPFSHPDLSQKIRPQESRVEQRISEQSVRVLVDKFVDFSRQYQKNSGNNTYSKEKGLTEGRYWTLMNILEKLGQRGAVQKVNGQASSGEPAEPIELSAVTQPDRSMTQSLLADFKRRYMLRLLPDSRPRIGIRDKITGRAKDIRAYVDYASGMSEGEFEELSGFLQTLGYGIQMDSIQQQAERILKRDPQRMRKQVTEQSTRKLEASIAKLHEETKSLENFLDDLEKPSDEAPGHE